jgi:hypothetical protein
MHAFRTAVEAHDLDQVADTLADDVVLNSPVTFKPFEGRDQVQMVLRFVSETFEDFRYVDEVQDGDTTALIFRANIGDKQIHGLDLLHVDADGQVDELTVMVRPMSAVIALAEAMGPKVSGAGIK